MKCCYLSVYANDLFSWQVAACQARQGRYVPSISELENLCGKDHAACPYYPAASMGGIDFHRRQESEPAFAS
ncbi:MAG: hypothetical protein BM485_00730 [Desulfobulbaceae bacterium DB1]|nr:MAG: hypothetical protein BM485_00730 [Desulfobulbaceae bacterium DB1]